MRIKVWLRILFVLGGVALVGCSQGSTNTSVTSTTQQAINNAGKVDTLLKVLTAKRPTVQNAKQAMPKGLLAIKVGQVGGAPQVLVDVLIQGDQAALPKLNALGVQVRTVTQSGIMTATTPLNKISAIAAIAEVSRIEAGKRVRMYNDISNAMPDEDCTECVGMNNDRSHKGEGVVVGVIDSGLDWTHGDFIDDVTGETRIAYYWDQSDTDDDRVPTGFTYGPEYTAAHINAGKVKDSYIFEKAAELGKPAVINMSLGTDFGPMMVRPRANRTTTGAMAKWISVPPWPSPRAPAFPRPRNRNASQTAIVTTATSALSTPAPTNNASTRSTPPSSAGHPRILAVTQRRRATRSEPVPRT